MAEAYIFDAVRTPRSKGKQGGTLNEVKPIRLLAGLLEGLQQRHDLDTARVDDVVMGCVAPVLEQGSCIAKAAAQSAGWDESVPGVQLDRFCASGLEAVNMAAAKVGSGQEDLVVAGGLESMSRVPIGSSGGPMFADPEFVLDHNSVPQGIGADLIATLDGYSREDVDAFAVESQRRAAHARDSGWFDRSVMPVRDENGATILERDDFIKPGTDMQTLGALKPSFAQMGALGMDEMAIAKYPQVNRINHVHTPGNSSGIVDGASAVLIGSQQAGRDIGLTPRARVVATAVLATDPVIMLTGPGPAAQKCLAKAGLTREDIDIWEINEAFASVALRYMRDLDIDHEITNVCGGAIAMGHPLGATGGALVSTVLDELERRDAHRAMISLCVGGGMGISTLIERV
ncbi:acetyl-CoA C-acetyltransferase [Lutimaribacter sp. EGI FJ00015]|uniref:Acetyl-CoA C-acetyltransferase n=1 Tax=Lutimaribacter degradans TaxID=2945989 RepID=A0ACC5ZVI3_9RHOB|nr:acetyl-CoA C-acetyltransferase [Lutimaribacter sp. EGI FJ00013]MCM2562092.1 acetyl-CoA C-acetyltransferase [Lutimaribacter sp. EGI FJ00013]MCO0613245.1 acetyl-CoA C-acetyltransferase [Lutimaribacter sp. EGI FJ00015]MCO0636222.1 acetyl-CoA C-acetyltransferase [Lutimaribacter sp. EGI FJ00014]